MTLSLTVLTVVVGCALGVVNYFTAEPIAEGALKARRDALSAVLPEFDNDLFADVAAVGNCKVYPATLGGNRVGVAVEAFSDAGFGGRISVLYGFDDEGKVLGYKVLSHSETPGLGANMQNWFDDEGTGHCILGSSVPLKVKADGGDIDAMTGATISSRAFLEALDAAREALDSYNSQQ